MVQGCCELQLDRHASSNEKAGEVHQSSIPRRGHASSIISPSLIKIIRFRVMCSLVFITRCSSSTSSKEEEAWGEKEGGEGRGGC